MSKVRCHVSLILLLSVHRKYHRWELVALENGELIVQPEVNRRRSQESLQRL